MFFCDRIMVLIDLGSIFLEFFFLVGYEFYFEVEVLCGGIIIGVGVVEGVECVIVVNDSIVKGGIYYFIMVKKYFCV